MLHYFKNRLSLSIRSNQYLYYLSQWLIQQFQLLLNPELRKKNKIERVQILKFKAEIPKNFVPSAVNKPADKTVLIEGAGNIDHIRYQTSLILAFCNAGYKPVVYFFDKSPTMQAAYELLGIEDFLFYVDYLPASVQLYLDKSLDQINDFEDVIKTQHKEIFVAKYACSTMMRQRRCGRVDLDNQELKKIFSGFLQDAIRFAEASSKMCAMIKPDALLQFDHGYTPAGEMFDAVLLNGGEAFTMNAAHRNGALMLKRYSMANRDQHPASLSKQSWQNILSLPWSREMGKTVLKEIKDCYHSGEWYGEVGTQFGKNYLELAQLKSETGIDPDKKTAIIFPHLFWDATFFWGTDLFDDYEDWFIATVQAACSNNKLNWIIKLHPASVIKDRRDGYDGGPSELASIKQNIGELPAHVRILDVDSSISTYSLFALMDFCITVRGTIGMEAPCFGIPTLTAGTGRYHGFGFTIDSLTKEEYLERLANLPERAVLSESAIELAQRYTYGVLLRRPIKMSSVEIGNRQDERASLFVEFDRLRGKEFNQCTDLTAISRWLQLGEEDFLSDDFLLVEDG